MMKCTSSQHLLLLAAVLSVSMCACGVDAFAPDLNVADTYAIVPLRTGISMHVRTLTVPDRDPNSAVVLVHGYPEGMAVWDSVLDRLEFNSYGIVLVPDLRGYNLTDKPTATADYDINLMAEDVLALIQTVLPARAEVLLVGHDIGGALAYLLASK
jgi:pimeloyl-ACP methyl ester carboxylesterase